jgi:hypothetical protein
MPGVALPKAKPLHQCEKTVSSLERFTLQGWVERLLKKPLCRGFFHKKSSGKFGSNHILRIFMYFSKL